MPQTYFSSDVFDFLIKLKRNNRREWFLRNKPRYEEVVKEPCIRFISDLAVAMREISPQLVVDPRASMFRIYRDIRFSADKKPYKTHVGLQFSLRGPAGKDVHAPGYYLHLEPGQCGIYAGIWHPDNATLLKIREAIVSHSADWKNATRGFELVGDSLSRPPHGFPKDHPLIEDLKRKDLMVSAELTDKEVCSPRFMSKFVEEARRMSPVVAFLARALRMKW